MLLQGWLLPSLGRQRALCKLCSLTSLALPSPHHNSDHRDKRTQHNRGTVGLWIEEGKFVLYLVSRTTCKVVLSCGGIFLSFVRFQG